MAKTNSFSLVFVRYSLCTMDFRISADLGALTFGRSMGVSFFALPRRRRHPELEAVGRPLYQQNDLMRK